MSSIRNPRRTSVALTAIGLVLVVTVTGCSSKSGTPVSPAGAAATAKGAKSLAGAGATFPQPFYEKVFADYEQANGTQVNYQSIGSGGGIKQFTAGTVDFGATDSPMKDDEVAAAEAKGGKVLHIPTVLGAVVVTYNLAGIAKPLRMDGKLIGDIFLGTVSKWNDRAVAAQNPGVSLPDLAIAPVHRSDGSGTTATFTGFVAKQNAAFDAKVGSGKEVRFPGGIGGKGNDGVAADVVRQQGSIGYVELNYALKNKLAFADVKNAAGAYVTPSIQSTSAAASDLSAIPADFRKSLVNAPAAGAYPIATWTFLLAFEQQKDAAKGKALVDLLWYLTHTGQGAAEALNYAPLPAAVMPKIEAAIKTITGPDGKPLLTTGQ